jgi:hypothetical protein
MGNRPLRAHRRQRSARGAAPPTTAHRKSRNYPAATRPASIAGPQSTPRPPAHAQPFRRNRSSPHPPARSRLSRGTLRPTTICSLFFICLRCLSIRAWQFLLLYFADPRVDDPRRTRRGLRHCELPAVLHARCPVLLRIGGSPPSRNLPLLLCLSEGVVLSSGTLTDYFNCSAFPGLKQYMCAVIFEAMSNPVLQAQYMELSSTRPTSSTEH